MTSADQAIDGLAAQECESLASCIARGQTPDTYADIVAKLRGHAEKLPIERRAFWTEQCTALGVTLFPPKAKSTKPEASSKP
jgi:hypothetical protein